MDFKWLRPSWLNVITTAVILSLPILREHVAPEEGGFVTEWYQPIVLLAIYIWQLEWKAIFLMLGFSLVIYIAVCLLILVITRVAMKK